MVDAARSKDAWLTAQTLAEAFHVLTRWTGTSRQQAAKRAGRWADMVNVAAISPSAAARDLLGLGGAVAEFS